MAGIFSDQYIGPQVIWAIHISIHSHQIYLHHSSFTSTETGGNSRCLPSTHGWYPICWDWCIVYTHPLVGSGYTTYVGYIGTFDGHLLLWKAKFISKYFTVPLCWSCGSWPGTCISCVHHSLWIYGFLCAYFTCIAEWLSPWQKTKWQLLYWWDWISHKIVSNLVPLQLKAKNTNGYLFLGTTEAKKTVYGTGIYKNWISKRLSS